jgi:phosphate transport system substrate-binding protein
VLAYNLPGVTELKLPREVYPLIFLGEVTSWNDPRIVAANPGVTLPDTTITAVRRSDASGTTFVLSAKRGGRPRTPRRASIGRGWRC